MEVGKPGGAHPTLHATRLPPLPHSATHALLPPAFLHLRRTAMPPRAEGHLPGRTIGTTSQAVGGRLNSWLAAAFGEVAGGRHRLAGTGEPLFPPAYPLLTTSGQWVVGKEGPRLCIYVKRALLTWTTTTHHTPPSLVCCTHCTAFISVVLTATCQAEKTYPFGAISSLPVWQPILYGRTWAPHATHLPLHTPPLGLTTHTHLCCTPPSATPITAACSL